MYKTVFDYPLCCRLLYSLGMIGLKISGWKIEGITPTQSKFVLIAAPHTSNWDFPIAMAVAFQLKLGGFWLGKYALFKGPCKYLFRWLGGIPIRRNSKTKFVERAVCLFKNRRKFVLALCPEGTRSETTHWKTGFYHIACEAKVPVVPVCIDRQNKIVTLGAARDMTGDQSRDLARLVQFYKSHSAPVPRDYQNLVGSKSR
ncbi:1-acyl-sn-glycerol-3-phosphate acyltransferase [Pelagibaculum spongiae]|uniref:1-acyl-sn-glycerol-3-phosphate acyltransferase n=1 Tax=Pelagibaculum spongiae TaxID=2080658 RepID=UPI001314B382|nr:1-acyl-sn-glycerol-3-phosphate acyltransferase [Pelagibaculum spongiae]